MVPWNSCNATVFQNANFQLEVQAREDREDKVLCAKVLAALEADFIKYLHVHTNTTIMCATSLPERS